MMRASLFYIVPLMIIGIACTDNTTDILGQWTVHDPFFSATYSIQQEGGQVVGIVQKYNDGTTQFSSNSKKQYLFRGLAKEGEIYVDGLTGATESKKPKTLEIKVAAKDTLEATIYTMNKPRKECWIRK